MKGFKCIDCGYYYKGKNDSCSCCHCTDDISPCEYEDIERENENLDEYGN